MTPKAIKQATDSKRETYITLELKVGEVLTDTESEKYLLQEKLGEGAMGWVFKARDERTGMIHAIKFMNSRMRGVPTMVKRFEREIKVLGKMNNPFILAAHDVRRFEIRGEEVVGFVTDFVEGPTLDEEIGKEGSLEPKQLVILAAQLAFALESLRKAGIVHRDLKPQNIFLQEMPNKEQFVRIGDFGIVGFAFESELRDQGVDSFRETRGEQLTEFGFAVGTPAFMSPEASSGTPLDHRSDLYSLGIVMYDMATGQPPFGGTAYDIMHKHTQTIPDSFAGLGVTSVPAWIERIIFRLLEKDPKNRYQSAAELFIALKDGVTEHSPKLLNEIPFIWDIKPERKFYDDTPTAIAA